MQINTELSPIISPKSNLSISFVSPRDNVLVNFTSNRTTHTLSDKNSMDLHHSRQENYNSKEAHDMSYRPVNDTMTNESYSVDRANQQDYSSRNNGYPVPHNEMMLIAENSTDRGHFYEDETSRSRVDNMNFIEFEEFIPNKCQEKKLSEEPANEEMEAKKTARIAISEDIEEKIDLATINLKHRNTGLKDPEVDNTHTAKKKYNLVITDDDLARNYNKTKFESCDLPLQDSRMSSNLMDNGPQLSKDSIKNDPFENQESSISNFNTKNEEVVINLKKENQDLKMINSEQADLIEFLKTELEKYREKDQEQIQILHHQNELLNKELEKMKHENVLLTQNLKESSMEKLRYKEKSDNQNDYITKIEEKYVVLETNNLRIEKELKKKDQENKSVIEENKALLDKKMKYKNSLKEKEQYITELKKQIDDFESIKHNELYVSVVEKNKIYKEKINQLTKQVDDQKELIKSKENAIENLLTRMDELTESLSGKNSEIVNLKDELSQYKKEVIPIKKNDRSNSANEKSNQNKAPNKEKEILNMLNKQLEEIENKANIKDDKRRNQSEGLSSAERIRPQENEKKPVFQSYDFNERNRHSENINVKGWDSTKLRQTYNSEKYDEAFEDDFIENAYKKPNKSHKSVDNEIKIKPSEPKEIRDSSNLEDLQKKLNILKNKRMEFEKRKSASSVGRDEERSRERDEYLSTQPNVRTKPLQLNNQNLTSPAASEKKPNWDERMTHKREKENSIKINNFTPEPEFQEKNSLFKSNSGNHSTEEAIKDSRPSSKNKIKRPPKIDNYQATQNFNKTDANLKTTLRYSSLSNTSSASTIKNETQYVKSHKKSFDATAKIDHHKFYESPAKTHSTKEKSVEKSGSKKDAKDWIHRGAMTPSSSLQASIMEKIMEGKLRK